MVDTLDLFQAAYTPRYKGCMLIIAVHMSPYIAIVATRWVYLQVMLPGLICLAGHEAGTLPSTIVISQSVATCTAMLCDHGQQPKLCTSGEN